MSRRSWSARRRIAGAEVTVVIEVDSNAGIPTDVLEKRIVEAFDQLGISVRWEAG